ncbi:MAG: DMT family transporter [Gammaproteobacteria bacterium]|nr:DMT family transporter [Gammaproteobacteria bacterium]
MTGKVQHDVRRGAALLVAGTLLVSVGDASVKWLRTTYPTYEVTFIRCLGGLILVLLFLAATGRLNALRTKRMHWHMARAVLVTFVMLSAFFALGHIPMVEVEAIGHAAPFFVALLSPVFLRERVTGHNWLAIAVGFLGVIIILRPDPAHFHVAHLYMFGNAIGYAVLILIARLLTSTESIFALNFYIYPLATVVTAIPTQQEWIAPTPVHWLLFGVFILCNTSAILLFLGGLRQVDATLAATLDYFTLVWVLLLGILIWHEYPDPISTIGIVFIVASGIYIVRHSTRKIDESIVQTTEH